MEEITLNDFKLDMSNISGLRVDLNPIMQTCGASPIHVYYKADEISVTTTYPERIILKSGNSTVIISQIKRIIRQANCAKYRYKLLCGQIKELETEITLTQI